MKTDRYTADKIWVKYFGNKQKIDDAFGYTMHRDEYGYTSTNGWEIDHIWPINAENGKQGANTYDNIQPLSYTSNNEKANKLQGKINDITFAVHKIETLKNNHIVGRMAIKDKEKWYWAYEKIKY